MNCLHRYFLGSINYYYWKLTFWAGVEINYLNWQRLIFTLKSTIWTGIGWYLPWNQLFELELVDIYLENNWTCIGWYLPWNQLFGLVVVDIYLKSTIWASIGWYLPWKQLNWYWLIFILKSTISTGSGWYSPWSQLFDLVVVDIYLEINYLNW